MGQKARAVSSPLAGLSQRLSEAWPRGAGDSQALGKQWDRDGGLDGVWPRGSWKHGSLGSAGLVVWVGVPGDLSSLCAQWGLGGTNLCAGPSWAGWPHGPLERSHTCLTLNRYRSDPGRGEGRAGDGGGRTGGLCPFPLPVPGVRGEMGISSSLRAALSSCESFQQ